MWIGHDCTATVLHELPNELCRAGFTLYFVGRTSFLNISETFLSNVVAINVDAIVNMIIKHF